MDRHKRKGEEREGFSSTGYRGARLVSADYIKAFRCQSRGNTSCQMSEEGSGIVGGGGVGVLAGLNEFYIFHSSDFLSSVLPPLPFFLFFLAASLKT